MARTPSPKPSPSRTPQSKHRLHFPNPKTPLSAIRETNNNNNTLPTEHHPVEVISRIRDPSSPLELSDDARSIRVRTDTGYRDFSLDGVSLSEAEDLEGFYSKYVASRIRGVRTGSKCTVIMYGPTGSGKSHTMFGCAKQPGIVYRALRDILGEGSGGEEDGLAGFGMGLFVQVAVLEIYNEEIYDLLSGNENPGAGLPKPNSTPKVRLEVMGKKAKNAMFISGNEAGKISKEVAKVEKRRIVKSTNCNKRSSRSHCMIILDVPSVGGRLMLVDMAGSENIDQAGQIGIEAKMQTGKINQGNIALKRVVESIANGDSHVPFRDSKLTMLLQDSFEDDKSKILMILCASPDPKEMHKTISTLEYGAKAKCIVRAAHIPTPRDKNISDENSALLRSRIEAMNQFIYKLQMENKIKEKERDEAHEELMRKEEEVVKLKSKVKVIEGRGLAIKEQEINSKVNERTQMLRLEITKMEEKMLKQQEELGMLRQRLEEMESNRRSGRCEQALQDVDGGRLMKRLSEIYAGGGDQGMEKSMDLDMGDQPAAAHDVREIQEDIHQPPENYTQLNHQLLGDEEDRVCLSTVFERDDEGEDRESSEGYEVDKEVVEEEYTGNYSRRFDVQDSASDCPTGGESQNPKDSAAARKTRIQNIFRLCGNYRELAQQVSSRTPPKKAYDDGNSSPVALGKELDGKGGGGLHENFDAEPRTTKSPISSLLASLASLHLDEQKPVEPQALKRCLSSFEAPQELKENRRLKGQDADGTMEVYVKWEASKELTGNFITKLKVLKNSTLSELRKLIETHLEEDAKNQSFTFLLLGDPSGAPVTKEKEGIVQVSKLPICNNQLNSHLACLRRIKMVAPHPNHIPFSSLENIISIVGA